MKDAILETIGLPLLRLSTAGSQEKDRIAQTLVPNSIGLQKSAFWGVLCVNLSREKAVFGHMTGEVYSWKASGGRFSADLFGKG